MTDRILVHNDARALALEREAYHGGRCDCFAIGRHTGEFFLLDVNSMYPSVMETGEYPCGYHGFTRPATPENLRAALSRRLVVADVTLRTENPAYPLVRDGKLVFPVGNFRAVLTTNELRYALERGDIADVESIIEYRGARCFGGFVRHFFGRRAALVSEGNTVSAWQTKILMNSLYGKFGQRGRIWGQNEEIEDESTGKRTYVDIDTGEVIRTRWFGGLKQTFTDAPEAFESIPAIAAHITANARMFLWRYIEQAGRENVYYCDTDSLLVNRAGLDRLQSSIDSTRLGALKIEGTYSDIEIWGPKDYRFGNKVRHKGVSAKAEQIDENRYRQWQWTSLRGLLRTGRIDAPGRKPVEKTLRRIYTKGVVDASNRVNPLRINGGTRDATASNEHTVSASAEATTLGIPATTKPCEANT